MEEWAKREIEIRNNMYPEDKYGAECCKSALRAFECLLQDGHSGYSIMKTKSILNALIDGRCLTPIEDTDDVWNEVTCGDKEKHYQCKRMSSLFKNIDNDGNVKYHDVNRAYYLDMNHGKTTWHSSWSTNLVERYFPITMPYIPKNKPYEVQACTYGKNVGEYDVYHILGIRTPNGDWVDINKFYKETDDGDIEITELEFKKLKEIRMN